MTLAVIYSRALVGIDAPLVSVETHISTGLPGFTIVGLPETAVKESKDRVRSALINNQFEFPARRITINLAPADLRKEGGRFDLPIALGILAASKQIPIEGLEQYEFAGELALSGELRPIYGALPLALGTRKANRILVIPFKNAEEAALPGDNTILAAQHLREVHNHLIHKTLLTAYVKSANENPDLYSLDLDLADVKGQMHAKRTLEIAAAGSHSVLMTGTPGTGKTMLASRIPSILPPLSNDEALEVTAIYSLIAQHTDPLVWGKRPFRAPHHTASSVALVGGGNYPRPGEISLAHHGILFLDELPEFDRKVLEVLREPLESGTILISRAARQTAFPANFQLIAAMNPCPCGHLGDPKHNCQCTQEQIKRYRARISGPLLDRIDMHIEVPAIPIEQLANTHGNSTTPETSATVLTRVTLARENQLKRSGKVNAKLSPKEMQASCNLDSNSRSCR